MAGGEAKETTSKEKPKNKSEIGLKALKKEVSDIFKETSDIFKDPEKRQKTIIAIFELGLLWIFKSDKDLAEKDKGHEEGEKQVARLKEAGLIETTKEKPKEAKKEEVVGNLQFLAANTHAIIYNKERINPKTSKKEIRTNPLGEDLKKLGIKPRILKGSISLFRNGIGNFESFQTRVAKMLQPDIKNPEKQLKNATEVLARCALGKYQIIPRHHFGHIKGWRSNDPLRRLKIMYDFMRSPKMQDEISLRILKRKMERYNGDPYAMSASYYGGNKSGDKMARYRQAIREGKTKGFESLLKKQTYGYGSIGKYSNLVVKYMKEYSGMKEEKVTASNIKYFQMAIGKKESGYLSGTRIKTA